MSDTYLYIAEQVYQWEYAIIFVMGIVISLVLWCFDWKMLNKKSRFMLSITVLLGSAALSSFIAYVKKEYDYLPEVNYNSYSYASVEQMLLNKGFKINDLLFDAIAEKKLEQGEEPASYYFKVTRMEPEPGTFVDKDAEVNLSVTWINYYENISVKPDGDVTNSDMPIISDEGNTNAFNAKTFYGDVDERYMRAYNSNEITLHISEKALNIYTENTVRGFGFYPKNVKVEAQLIDYETNETISTQTAEIGNEITFEDIPDGVYYYMISAEGYEMYVPYSLFCLEYNESKEKDILPWGIDLERIECDYSEQFKILLCNEQGIPLGNVEAEIRVVSEENLSPNRYSAYPIASDENGYLAIWRKVDDIEYYDIAEFSVKSECQLQICLKNSSNYFTVEIKDGVGICKLPK